MEMKNQAVYYAAFFTTSFDTIEEAKAQFPDALAAHIARSKEFHEAGTLLMSGAFLHNPGEPLSTMAALASGDLMTPPLPLPRSMWYSFWGQA